MGRDALGVEAERGWRVGIEVFGREGGMLGG